MVAMALQGLGSPHPLPRALPPCLWVHGHSSLDKIRITAERQSARTSFADTQNGPKILKSPQTKLLLTNDFDFDVQTVVKHIQ